MGPEIMVIPGFRNNRGQKSADLVISEPRNNSSSNLSELGILDLWILPCIKYHMSQLPIQCLVWYLSAIHVTITHNKESRTHLYDSVPRLSCARQSFVLTQTRQQHHHHHRNHHRHTTPAAQQQHSSRDSSRGGGDLTSPATVYVPDFKNKGKRQNKTCQFKIKPLLPKNQTP